MMNLKYNMEYFRLHLGRILKNQWTLFHHMLSGKNMMNVDI